MITDDDILSDREKARNTPTKIPCPKTRKLMTPRLEQIPLLELNNIFRNLLGSKSMK